ncbi:hypothetical protein P7K49_031413, partial [Saguinus oedipus]
MSVETFKEANNMLDGEEKSKYEETHFTYLGAFTIDFLLASGLYDEDGNGVDVNGAVARTEVFQETMAQSETVQKETQVQLEDQKLERIPYLGLHQTWGHQGKLEAPEALQ